MPTRSLRFCARTAPTAVRAIIAAPARMEMDRLNACRFIVRLLRPLVSGAALDFAAAIADRHRLQATLASGRVQSNGCLGPRPLAACIAGAGGPNPAWGEALNPRRRSIG